MVDLEFLTLVNKDQLEILTGGGTVTSVDGETVSFTQGTVLLTTDDTEERLAELEANVFDSSTLQTVDVITSQDDGFDILYSSGVEITLPIKGGDGVVADVSVEGDIIELRLDPTYVTYLNRASRALITPVTAPAEPMIPVIGVNNAQQNVALGDGLAIKDDKLVTTGIVKRLYKHIVSVPVNDPSEGQVSTCIFEALNDNGSPLDSTNVFGIVPVVTENSDFIPLNLIAVPSEAGFILVYLIGGQLMYYRFAEYEIEDTVEELGEVSES